MMPPNAAAMKQAIYGKEPDSQKQDEAALKQAVQKAIQTKLVSILRQSEQYQQQVADENDTHASR